MSNITRTLHSVMDTLKMGLKMGHVPVFLVVFFEICTTPYHVY